MHARATGAVSPSAPSNPADAELRLRAERAEQHVADLKAALENMKNEETGGRTMAERRSLPDQRAEGTLRAELRDWWWRLSG